ncbi:MAG: hypothetical protein ACXVC3_05040 [Bdellovibrio sp.]
MKLFLVWIPSAALAAILYFGKKGKPENYLLHWIRFQFTPASFSAFSDSSQWKTPPSLYKAASNGRKS